MKINFKKLVILLVLIFSGTILSQTTDTTFINGDSLKINDVTVEKGWDFHLGDDSTWALPTFNSVGWDTVDSRLNMDSINTNYWTGIGWFRKTIVIDSSLLHKEIGLVLSHYGASELYVNGKEVSKYGFVTDSSDKEIIYHENLKPIFVRLDSTLSYTLAVRFSNHSALAHTYLYPRITKNIGFIVKITNWDDGLNRYTNTITLGTSLGAGLAGIFMTLSVIYLLLFSFYSSQKEYLYYTIFTFSMGVIFLFSFISNIIHSSLIFYFARPFILPFFLISIFVSVVAFLYKIFYGRMLKLMRYLLLIAISAYTLFYFNDIDNILEIVSIAVILISSIEILRVIITSIIRKKPNAWVIGAGVGFFAGFIVVLIIIGIFGSASVNNVYLVFSFLLSIPISMSVYLARSSAQTNENLNVQLTNVQKLSEEAIEQEKKAAKLALETQHVKAENERKTQELEYAKEIEKAYTELKATQTQLVHSEKMASLGELTAGIAHEIKNPLNFINNFSEISNELLDEVKIELQNKNEEEVTDLIMNLKQNLEKITQHGKRADSIVKGMLLHSRGTAGEKILTDINDLLDQYVNLAYHGMRATNKEFNITIEKDYDESLEKINVVPQDISRVFLNIINNGCYAAYDKKKKSSDNNFSPTLEVSTKNLDGKVEIRINDNGNGIPRDIVDKIFQPFFTTKPTGEGTGLGLSLSYDIVTKMHNGELKVETYEGEGTNFIILLPKNL